MYSKNNKYFAIYISVIYISGCSLNINNRLCYSNFDVVLVSRYIFVDDRVFLNFHNDFNLNYNVLTFALYAC